MANDGKSIFVALMGGYLLGQAQSLDNYLGAPTTKQEMEEAIFEVASSAIGRLKIPYVINLNDPREEAFQKDVHSLMEFWGTLSPDPSSTRGKDTQVLLGTSRKIFKEARDNFHMDALQSIAVDIDQTCHQLKGFLKRWNESHPKPMDIMYFSEIFAQFLTSSGVIRGWRDHLREGGDPSGMIPAMEEYARSRKWFAQFLSRP